MEVHHFNIMMRLFLQKKSAKKNKLSSNHQKKCRIAAIEYTKKKTFYDLLKYCKNKIKEPVMRKEKHVKMGVRLPHLIIPHCGN